MRKNCLTCKKGFSRSYETIKYWEIKKYCSRVCGPTFKNGNPGHWLGKKRSEADCKAISDGHKGQNSSPPTQFKKSENPAYNRVGGRTPYRNLHHWVGKKLGKPNQCSECGTIAGGKGMHWANKSHEYKKEVSDWIRLCVKCHYEYDLNRHVRLKDYEQVIKQL